MRKITNPAPLLSLLFILVAVPFIYQQNYMQSHRMVFNTLIPCIIFLGYVVARIKNIKFRFNDLTVLLIIIYGILNLLLTATTADPFKVYQWIGMAAVYIIFRNLRPTGFLIAICFVIAGLVQTVYGFLQYIDLLPSNNQYFAVTGSFFNPGIYGGFLAVCFTIPLFYLAQHFRSGRYPKTIFISTIIIGAGVLLSDSRAAWVATILASLVFTYVQVHHRIKMKYVWGLVLVVLFSAGFFKLYDYRQDSADARLLIWRVSSGLVMEKPVLGHGMGSFPSIYMPAQADYLRQDTDGSYALLASDNTHAFNDFIKILCEQGIIGLVLFILLMAGALRSNGQPGLRFLKYGIITLLVFSFFSYPSDVIPLKLLIPMMAGLLPGKLLGEYHPGSRLTICKYILAACIIISIYPIYKQWKTYNRIDSLILSIFFDESEEAELEMSALYPKIKHSGDFQLRYARVRYLTGEPSGNIPILEDARRLLPSSEILCDLGKTYQQAGFFDKAEDTFLQAAYTVPGYVMPRYNLFNLYRAAGDTQKADEAASFIITMKVKVESDLSRGIRTEAEQYIENSVKQ